MNISEDRVKHDLQVSNYAQFLIPQICLKCQDAYCIKFVDMFTNYQHTESS
jgi:hypothetical protein